MGDQYYTAREFAIKMGVSRQAVYKWIKAGHLEVVEETVGPFKHILIPKKVADKFTSPPKGRPKIKG